MHDSVSKIRAHAFFRWKIWHWRIGNNDTAGMRMNTFWIASDPVEFAEDWDCPSSCRAILHTEPCLRNDCACIPGGCAPGGTTSNVFTYWSRGNVALSIVMSIASTVCAFFMVPLCILIYIESRWAVVSTSALCWPYGCICIESRWTVFFTGMWQKDVS